MRVKLAECVNSSAFHPLEPVGARTRPLYAVSQHICCFHSLCKLLSLSKGKIWDVLYLEGKKGKVQTHLSSPFPQI